MLRAWRSLPLVVVTVLVTLGIQTALADLGGKNVSTVKGHGRPA
jgi:hypothetical protein